MYKMECVTIGPIATNCYTVINEDTNEAILIDATGDVDSLLRAVRKSDAKLVAILLTHAHFDHFGAAAEIMEQTGLPLYVHELDRAMLLSPEVCLAENLGFAAIYRKPDEAGIRTFTDNETLKFSEELEFLVIHTPGHSPGSSCFRHGDILFSGDTLFRDGVGRVDFKGGNIHDMRASLARLGAIEGDCTVYCGHYGSTTLEHERTYGHYLIPRKL